MRKHTVLFGTLFLLVSALLNVSCAGPNTLHKPDLNIGKYSITTIDSCQYVVVNNGQYGITMTHKGDCTNPIHPRVNQVR